jgi:hypothetical protein
MLISIAALIVAVATLIWIMIQSIRPSTFNKLTTRIDAQPASINDEDWLYVYVHNKNAAPIAVSSVIVYFAFESLWLRSYFPWSNRFLRGKAFRYGVNPFASEDGQEFDCTIEAYHTQKWKVDRTYLLKEWAATEGHSDRFLVEVRLATGTTLSKKIPVDADRPPVTVIESDTPEDLEDALLAREAQAFLRVRRTGGQSTCIRRALSIVDVFRSCMRVAPILSIDRGRCALEWRGLRRRRATIVAGWNHPTFLFLTPLAVHRATGGRRSLGSAAAPRGHSGRLARG